MSGGWHAWPATTQPPAVQVCGKVPAAKRTGVRAVRLNELDVQLKLHALPCVSPTGGVGRQGVLSVGQANRQARDEPPLVQGVVAQKAPAKHPEPDIAPNANGLSHCLCRLRWRPLARLYATRGPRGSRQTPQAPIAHELTPARAPSCATREPAAWLNSAHRQPKNLSTRASGETSVCIDC